MDQFRRVFDVAAAIAVVAAITALVRPGSQGPQLVRGIGDAFVSAAAGTVGATITPDTQIPGAGSATAPRPAPSGTALGQLGQFNPHASDTPSGAHPRVNF